MVRSADSRAEELTNRLRERCGSIPGVANLTFGLATSVRQAGLRVAAQQRPCRNSTPRRQSCASELVKLSTLRDVVDTDRPGNREVVLQLKDKAQLLGLTMQDIVRPGAARFLRPRDRNGCNAGRMK